MSESITVHETFQGMPQLDVTELVDSSKQTMKRGGTGTGTHVLQLRGSGLFSGKKPTPIERAYVRNLFSLWSRKIVVRRDNGTTYDGWIARRRWDAERGALTLTTVELRAAQFRVRLTYPVLRHLEGDLAVTDRNAEGATRAVVERAMIWGGGFVLPIDLCPDGAGGGFTAYWPWYQHLTIEDLLQQIEKTGHEVYFRPYESEIGAARYQTVVAPKIVGETYSLSFSAAKGNTTAPQTDEDGSGMMTGIEYQGNGFDKDALYAGANWGTLFPDNGLAPIPNRDSIRNAKDVTDPNVLAQIALADLVTDHVPEETQPFDLQMDDTVSAAWGRIGTLLESRQVADEWNDDVPRHHRVVACTTAIGSDVLGLELERHG